MEDLIVTTPTLKVAFQRLRGFGVYQKAANSYELDGRGQEQDFATRVLEYAKEAA